MQEPLFEFLYSPFNLLQYFKDGVHRSKTENILVSDLDSKKASGSGLTCFHSWAQRKLSPLSPFSPLNILLTINGLLLS